MVFYKIWNPQYLKTKGKLYMENNDFHEIKLGLELVKKDIQQFERIIEKIDTTNDRIQELIMNISKISDLHEQKLFNNLKDVEYVWNDIEKMNKRISILENYKWILVGAIAISSFTINVGAQFFLQAIK